MKKLLFFILPFASLAQVSTLPYSIGIGQNTLSTIPLHIFNNGEVARFQGAAPYVSFYEGATFKGYLQAINNNFEIGSKNNHNIEFYTGDTPRFRINGDGTGVFSNVRFNATSGINLIGPLRVAGNNVGTLGDVLMSLGNGTPAWASVNFNPQVGCQVTFPSSFTIPHNSDTFLLGFTENYDTSNNMNPLTGEFTVPSDGIYHFEGKLSITKQNVVDPNIVNGILIIDLVVNNFDKDRIILDFRTHVQSTAPHKLYQNTLFLNTNDVVKFKVKQLNEQTNSITMSANSSTNDTRINIYKVY